MRPRPKPSARRKSTPKGGRAQLKSAVKSGLNKVTSAIKSRKPASKPKARPTRKGGKK